MKYFALLATTLCLLVARVEAKNGLLYPITLGKFENHSSYTGPLDLSTVFGAGVADLMQASGLFFIVPDADMRSAAAEKGPTFANMSPAQLLVKGEITAFTDGAPGTSRAEITAIVTLVDIATGQVKGVKNIVSQARYVGASPGLTDPKINDNLDAFKKTNAGQVLNAAAEDVMGFCVAQLVGLPWAGSVILVKGNQIYFNRGEREGVVVGQVYRVGSTEIVRDPGSGDVLDNRFTERAQVRVDSVKERVATCSLIIGSGIERGLTVLLKE
jgi:hypothetical protein